MPRKNINARPRRGPVESLESWINFLPYDGLSACGHAQAGRIKMRPAIRRQEAEVRSQESEDRSQKPTPANRSRIKTTGESIVREFRLSTPRLRQAGIADRTVRVEIPVSKEPVSIFEKAVRIFLIFASGWAFGYLHHFLATAR